MKIIVLGLALLLLTQCAHLTDDATAKNEEKARIYLQLATEHYTNKKYGEALRSTLLALEVIPDYPPALNHLGLIYMEAKDFEKSEAAFMKALAQKPNYAEVRNNLGVLYNRQGKYQKAIPEFEAALESKGYLTPESALTNMGYAYYRLGKTEKAKMYHQRALDLVPQFCLANKNIGDIYAKEKKFQKANSHYKKAVTYCPLYQESQYKLALTWIKIGEKPLARTEFRRLIKTHKEGPYVNRSEKALKFLREK